MIIFLKIVSKEGFYANDLLGQKVSWSQNGYGQWGFWGATIWSIKSAA